MTVTPDIQMWFVLALTFVAVILYVTEWVSMEITSLLLLSVILVAFQVFPLSLENGEILDSVRFIKGFSNPALITVLALLVVGDALTRTGALEGIYKITNNPNLPPKLSIGIILLFVAFLSAFLNNTPVVVIFIPILRALAERAKMSPSKVMMPLSYMAILGGTTTIIGSSTNLLVSSALIDLGYKELDFFAVTPMALVLLFFSSFYVYWILPKLLPDKEGGGEEQSFFSSNEYISQFVITEESALVGEKVLEGGLFPKLTGLKVRSVTRGKIKIYPPFIDYEVKAGDVLVVLATRKAIANAAMKYPESFYSRAIKENDKKEDSKSLDAEEHEVIVEAMIPPSSRLVGLNTIGASLSSRFNCLILGILRRDLFVRGKMTEMIFEAGDVILIKGHSSDISKMYERRDIIVQAGTSIELPKVHNAKRSIAIFGVCIGMATLGILPIMVASLIAVTLMIALKSITIRQSMRAIDPKIILIVVASLALGDALFYTGGARFLADEILALTGTSSIVVVLSALYLLVALLTNVLSNNACAVLFTPIGVNIALSMHHDPVVFALTVLLAANCSFASPVGYKTNILVMGQGNYSFKDFVKAGFPLLIFTWVVFSVAAPILWGL